MAAISTSTNAILSSTLVIVINQLRERITLLKKNMYQIMDKLNDLMVCINLNNCICLIIMLL
jgi:hypothetical protein